MTKSTLRTITLGLIELLVAVALVAGATERHAQVALATPNNPVLIDSQGGPSGITLGSPWIVESGGATAWTYGTSSTGYGTFVTYKPGTGTWSTTQLQSSETGVLAGAYSASANLAAFTATRSGFGNRIVFVNLATGTKTASRQMTVVQTNLRALAFDPTGANLWVATNDVPSLMIKLSSATANEVTYTALNSPYKEPTSMVPFGSQMVMTFATSPVKLMSFSTTSVSMTSNAALPLGTPTLVDPLVVGGVAYYGSDSTPGRITAIDLATLTVVGSLDLAAGETGAHGLSMDATTDTLTFTTSTSAGPRLVVATASTLTRRGDTDLGVGSNAVATFRTGQRLTVGFAGTRGVSTLTTAAVPNTPTGITVGESDSELTVAWPAVASAEPVTGYTVTASGGGDVVSCSTATTTCTLLGLRNGTDYAIAVTATSIAGTSPAGAATGNPRTLPTAPTGVTAERRDNGVAVGWSTAADGGRPILEYVATATPGGWTCTATITHCTISGLTNGARYTVHVTARTSIGTSALSAESSSVIPATTPGAPKPGVVDRGNGTITVHWSAPISDGGLPVDAYTVHTDPMSQGCTTTTPSCIITGLRNGTAYRLTVVAQNGVGSGDTAQFAQTVTPATTPSSVRELGATRADRSVHLDWSAPSDDGGDPVSEYRVTSAATGLLVCATVEPRCTIGPLENGVPVSFDITAVNGVGAGTAVRSVSVVPASRPAPVSAPTATRGDRRVTLHWDAPGGNAGVPVLRYEVFDLDGTLRCTSAERTCTVDGLPNGIPVRFSVVAVNEVGASDVSIPSTAVIPATHPSTVTRITAIRGNRSVHFEWTSPVDDGGEPITEYRVVSTSTGEIVCATVSRNCEVVNLTNGIPVSFAIVATNAAGDSPVAETESVVPATFPEPVAAPSVNRGSQSATVSWSEPSGSAGVPVLSYVVIDERGNVVCVSPIPSCTVTGLENGLPQRFSVIAVNEVGASAESSYSAAVTPATVPDAPVAASVTANDGGGTITWTRGESNGGDPVSSYVVRVWWEASVIREFATNDTTVTLNDLVDGEQYRVTIAALNGVGESASSAPALFSPVAPPVVDPPVAPPVPDPTVTRPPTPTPTPRPSTTPTPRPTATPTPSPSPTPRPVLTAPGQPFGVALLTMQRRTAVFGWGAPSSGGSAILDYRIEIGTKSNGTFRRLTDSVSDATVSQVKRPTAGKWFVRVIAVNAIGASTPSTPVRIIVR
jgi:titin